MTTLKPASSAAALKAERARDKALAVRDYEADKLAWQTNMMRLRALRLARESTAGQTASARRPIKKKPAPPKASPTRARRAQRVVP